jgi:hypothetical protein
MRTAQLVLIALLGLCAAQAAVASSGKAGLSARKPVIKWPRAVVEQARSKDGKLLAIQDSTGLYIADANGEHPRKTNIKVNWDDEDTVYSLSFNKSGTLLAVLAGGWYGEPHIQYESQLWCVDTKSAKARWITSYSGGFLGNDFVTKVGHALGAWSKDDKSIEITAEVYFVADGVADVRYLRNETFTVRVAPPDKRPKDDRPK